MFERVYRALLLLYPREFRRDYGEPMAQAFGDRMRREGGGLLSAAVWAQTLADLVPSAFKEHRERAAREGLTVRSAALVGAWFVLRSLVGGLTLCLLTLAFALLIGSVALTTGWFAFDLDQGPLGFFGYTLTALSGGGFEMRIEFALPAFVLLYGVAMLLNAFGAARRARRRKGGASAWPEV